MPWVVTILQRTGEQRAEKLRRIERAISAVVLRNHYSRRGIPCPREERSLLYGRGKISRVLVQDGRQSEPLNKFARFRVCQCCAETLSPTLRTSAIMGPLIRSLTFRCLKRCGCECVRRIRGSQKESELAAGRQGSIGQIHLRRSCASNFRRRLANHIGYVQAARTGPFPIHWSVGHQCCLTIFGSLWHRDRSRQRCFLLGRERLRGRQTSRDCHHHDQ